MRRLPLIVLVAALVLPAAASAQSRVVETGSRFPYPPLGHHLPAHLSGPVFSGDTIAWAERRRREGTRVVVALGPDGRRRIVDRRKDSRRLFRLSGGEGRLALLTWSMDCPPGADVDSDCVRYMGAEPSKMALNAGPVSGPLTPVTGTCGPLSVAVAARALGVRCGPLAGEVLEADGTRRTYETGGSTGDFRVAGDFAAFIRVEERAPVLVVVRRATGEVVVRVPGTAAPSFDLAPDGTVAYRLGDRRIGWSSPAEPGVHPIDLAHDAHELRLGGHRIAVRSRTADFVGGRFAVLERDGRTVAEHEVAIESPPEHEMWDFDGRRLTWAQRPCSRSYVVVWDVATPAPVLPGTGCTRAVPRGRIAHLNKRRLRIPLRCPGDAEAGCGGFVQPLVNTVRGGATDVIYLRSPEREALFDRDAGTMWHQTFRLSRREAAKVRRSRRAWLTLIVSTTGHPERRYRIPLRLPR